MLTRICTRVRREDLYGSSGSDGEDGDSRDDEADAVLRSKLNAQLAGLLDLDLSVREDETLARKTSTEQTRKSRRKSSKPTEDDDDRDDSSREDEVMGDDGGVDEDDEPVEFAFRLFSGEDPSQKVVLEKQQDESAGAAGDSGLMLARRPDSYYIAQSPSAEMLDKFRAAAVSYDLLLADAGVLRWGVEKPWKVTTITITATKKNKDGKEALVGSIAGSEPRTTRKRPGKKRRIVLRTRDKAKKKKEVTTKQEAVDKEQHVLDKKKRLNRQKKLKRRAKAKEQKQQGGAGDDTSDGDDSDGK